MNKKNEKIMPRNKLFYPAFCPVLSLFLCMMLLAGCTSQKNIFTPDIDSREVSRLELGVRVKSVSEDNFAIPDEIGGRSLLVIQVKPGSYAAAMGIKTDDLIYRINGKRVTGMADSYAVMRKIKDMRFVLVELLREGEVMKFSLNLKKG